MLNIHIIQYLVMGNFIHLIYNYSASGPPQSRLQSSHGLSQSAGRGLRYSQRAIRKTKRKKTQNQSPTYILSGSDQSEITSDNGEGLVDSSTSKTSKLKRERSGLKVCEITENSGSILLDMELNESRFSIEIKKGLLNN